MNSDIQRCFIALADTNMMDMFSELGRAPDPLSHPEGSFWHIFIFKSVSEA